MRILLINAKINWGNVWIPIGLLYIAAYLRKFNIEVKIVDRNIHPYNSNKKLVSLIKEHKPNMVGISGMTVQCNDAILIGRLIKDIDRNIKVIYGGVHFTFKPENGLKYGDICVIGEGEETFLQICKEQDNLYKVKNIVFKENNKLIFTKFSFIDNLDKLPFPAYDLIKMEDYNDRLITGERAISILSGRGCPYNCIFCVSSQFWKRRVRYHSLDYTISHINYLIKNYNLKNLRIMDDTFTLNKKRVLEFCDRIKENKFKLNITCLTNIKNADYEMFKKMKEVGFSIIAFGVESGDDEILNKINKGITKKDIRNAVTAAKKAGLKIELLFMIGNIGENKDTIMDSISFAKELNLPESNDKVNYNWFQFATPFPGSKFFDIAEQYGSIITKDWNKYHHQTPVFIPTSLSKKGMLRLRKLALKESNNQKFLWIPQSIRYNSFVQKTYQKLLKFKDKWAWHDFIN